MNIQLPFFRHSTFTLNSVLLNSTKHAESMLSEMKQIRTAYENLSFISNIAASLTDFKNELENLKRHVSTTAKGITGELAVLDCLRDSSINLYILYDLYLKKNDLHSQIDMIAITSKHIYVIESKWREDGTEFFTDKNGTIICHNDNWSSDYPINPSPFSQNNRHIHTLSEIIIDDPFLKRTITNDMLVPVVVLSNANTSISEDDVSFSKFVHINQLISYIEDTDANSNQKPLSSKTMRKIGTTLLECLAKCDTDRPQYYKNKFFEFLKQYSNYIELLEQIQQSQSLPDNVLADNLEKLYNLIVEQNPQHLYILDPSVRERIVQQRPSRAKQNLLSISGIGNTTIQYYEDIIYNVLEGKVPSKFAEDGTMIWEGE